jgi:hypothetical protein
MPYVTAEDLFLSIRTDGEVYDDLVDICRQPVKEVRKARMLAEVRDGWQKYKRTVNSCALIHSADLLVAADMLMEDMMEHYKESYPEEQPAVDAYFIIDDCLSDRPFEGYILMYGNPYTAIGNIIAEAKRMYQVKARVPAGEPVYRVFLARRHKDHKVVLIKQNKA